MLETIRTKLRAIRELKLEELRPIIDSLGDDPKAQLAAETLLDPAWIDIAAENYLELARHAAIADEQILHRAMRESGTILFEARKAFCSMRHSAFIPTRPGVTRPSPMPIFCSMKRAIANGARALAFCDPISPVMGPAPSLRKIHRCAEDYPSRTTPMTVGRDTFALEYSTPSPRVMRWRSAGALTGSQSRIWTACEIYPRMFARHTRMMPHYRASPDWMTDFSSGRKERSATSGFTPKAALETSDARTKALSICRPKFTPLQAAGEEAFVEQIGSMLTTPVSITSSGPTAKDKADANSQFSWI